MKNKGMLGAIVFLVLAFFLYRTFFGSAVMPEMTAESGKSGADLVEIASKLSNITFSRDFFTSASYRSLIDFSTPLFPQPAGRSNPFNAIGRD